MDVGWCIKFNRLQARAAGLLFGHLVDHGDEHIAAARGHSCVMLPSTGHVFVDRGRAEQIVIYDTDHKRGFEELRAWLKSKHIEWSEHR